MEARSRVPLIVALCTVLVALGVGVLLWRPSHGDLEVTSEPPGASVFLDQEFQGVTPTTLGQLTRGSHQLRLAAAGCRDSTQVARISRRRAAVHVRLERVPPTAVLVVRSEPSGAHVWVDGERRTQTPARIDSLSPGARELRVEKAGWLPHSETIELTDAQERVVSVKLVSQKVAYYEDAIKKAPDNPLNHIELARLHVRNGELGKTLDLLKKASCLSVKTAQAYARSSYALVGAIRQVDPDLTTEGGRAIVQALFDAVRGQKLEPDTVPRICDLFSQSHLWREIRELTTLCIERGDDQRPCLRWRAIASARLGKEEQFQSDFDKLLGTAQAGGQDDDIDASLHKALKELGRWREVLRLVGPHLRSRPEDSKLRLWALEARAQLGEKDAFEEEIRPLLEAIREDPRRRGRLYALLRPVLLRMKDYEKMRDLCNLVSPVHARNSQFQRYHLEALYLSREWKQLLRVCEALEAEDEVDSGTPPVVRAGFRNSIPLLWSKAWALLALGEDEALKTLIARHERYQADEHYWVTAVRGEAWRKSPVGHPPKPWLEARPCERAPTVDGRLDEPAWKGADRSSKFVVVNSHEPMDRQTTILATYDADALYVGIIAHGERLRDAEGIGQGIFPEERLELFLDASLDYRTYKQFMFSGRGYKQFHDCASGVFALRLIVNQIDGVGFEFAATEKDGNTHYEIALSYAMLDATPPKPGEVWGFNLVHQGRKAVSFVPLLTHYHRPGRFAFLLFR